MLSHRFDVSVNNTCACLVLNVLLIPVQWQPSKKDNSHVKTLLIWETSASLQLKSLKHKLRRIPALDWWVSTCKNKPMFTFPSSTMVQMCAVRYTCVGPIRHASKAVSGTSISIILTPTAPVHTPAPYFFFNSAIAANDFSATSVGFFLTW